MQRVSQIMYVVLAPATPTTKQHLKLVLPPKTPDEVRQEFANKGISVRAWALANSFNPSLVYEILSGRTRKCTRGESHKIAVRLGLKKGVITKTKSIKNAI